MIEAHAQMQKASIETSASVSAAGSRIEKAPSSEQEKLQSKYNKGEISFDEFKREWEKLG